MPTPAKSAFSTGGGFSSFWNGRVPVSFRVGALAPWFRPVLGGCSLVSFRFGVVAPWFRSVLGGCALFSFRFCVVALSFVPCWVAAPSFRSVLVRSPIGPLVSILSIVL